MKWSNLPKNKCPKCGRPLTGKVPGVAIVSNHADGRDGVTEEIARPTVLVCSRQGCDFGIGADKFRSMCAQMATQ